MAKGKSSLGTTASKDQGPPEKDEKGFAAFDPAEHHDLYAGAAYYQQQQLTAAEKGAMTFYTDPDPEPAYAAPSADGLHSPSQDLNWALSQGIPLSAKQQEMHDALMGAMHNTGHNINLTRYDHADFVNDILKQAGVHTDATKMSVAALKKALVGQVYGENKFVSGSYNDFANAPGAGSKWDKATFKERFVKITYKVDANVQSVMPGNSPKKDPLSGLSNKLGEQIMAPSKPGKPNYEVMDVKLTGAKAHPKGSSKGANMHLNQIEIVVHVTKQ